MWRCGKLILNIYVLNFLIFLCAKTGLSLTPRWNDVLSVWWCPTWDISHICRPHSISCLFPGLSGSFGCSYRVRPSSESELFEKKPYNHKYQVIPTAWNIVTCRQDKWQHRSVFQAVSCQTNDKLGNSRPASWSNGVCGVTILHYIYSIIVTI